ncbi:TPA: hypothetical protein ACH3X2_013770 [Trebouxia sp. C0005]
MSGGMPYGLQAMLKEGHQHMSGMEEAVFRNIEACKQLSMITKTSMGPNGMNKMVINHLEKLFVTSDASTIVNELEIQHPAARLIVLAAQAQEQEIGDATNFALQILETLIIKDSDKLDIRNKQAVAQRIRGAVSSKQYGFEDLLCPLIAQACIDVCPKNPNNFNVDNVRVIKITGSGAYNSSVVKGIVIKRDTEGTVKSVTDAKVAVFAQGVDTSSTETKGTVLIKNAEELQTYSQGEEDRMEQVIKGIADSGAKVVVAGSAYGEMAMHFIEKYGMMALRLPSKFDMRRFCRATGATALVKLAAPQPDELGFAKSLALEEIGGTNVVVLQQDASQGQVSTVVLRASTDNTLDDLERAVDDGVNAYKALCRDSRMLPAGGAPEIELCQQLQKYGRKETGLDQYAIAKYAESLEASLNATDVVSSLHAAHANGQQTAGLDIETGQPKDLAEDGILDLYSAKWWALKLATDAVVTVLRVDQIIMSKQAGGPKPRQGGGDDED